MAASAQTRLSAHGVFLVGFMGAGKTTVGRALAARLGWRFVDLDDLIVQRSDRPIAEIFEHSGEAEFRRLERHQLASLLDAISPASPTVVALGGGAYVDPENAASIASARHPMVFLDAPVEELWRRCQEEAGLERPLRQHEAQFRQLYALRRPHYLKATAHLDTMGHEVPSIVSHIIAALELNAVAQEDKS